MFLAALLVLHNHNSTLKESDLKKIVEHSNIKWIYVLVSVVLMVIYGTVYSWGIFRIPVENHFGVGTTLSGLPYMTFLLTYAISMLIGGKLIKKYTPRKLLLVGGCLISLGWILSSFSSNIFLLTISYGIVIGFGVGISYGVPIYVIINWFPKKRGMIVGVVLAGFGLSPLFTAPLGHWFINSFGLKETFLYYGLIFGLVINLLALIIRLPASYNSDEISNNRVTNNKMTKTKSFKYAYICFFLGTLIGLTIIGLTSNVARDLVGLEADKIALLMVIFALFNGLGRPLFGWMTEKYGPRNTMRFSYTLIIFASLGMFFVGEATIVLYIIMFSTLWMNLGAWLAIAPMMTMKLYGKDSYSENYGIMFTAYGLGAVVGVISTGLLIDQLNNYQMIFALIVLLSLLGFFISDKVEHIVYT